MADMVLIAEESLQDIADAIREKTGEDVKYRPSEMAEAIKNIPVYNAEPFAIYSEDDHSLSFYNGLIPEIGEIHYGKTVTNVYLGFDTVIYSSDLSVPWYSIRTSVKSVIFDKSFVDIQPIAMAYWFYDFTNLMNIDATYFDVSKVTTLYCTFEGCSNLTDISTLSNWDISNVTTLRSTFRSCTSLTNADSLSTWNTANVTDMYRTFRGCSGLTNIDTLSGWDTSKVMTLYEAFRGCTNLTEIDISGWNTKEVADMQNMFYSCSNLETIYSDDSNFVTSAVTSGSGMFTSCSKLVGGNGTKYSSDKVTQTMAHIDTSSNPGYFTQAS